MWLGWNVEAQKIEEQKERVVEMLEGTVRGTKDGEGDRMGIWRCLYGNVYN